MTIWLDSRTGSSTTRAAAAARSPAATACLPLIKPCVSGVWTWYSPELQFFLDHKVPQVKFVDRTFNCKRDHTLGIWRYLVEHDNGITNFHFEVSADIFDEEELELIGKMRPG